jgi:ABC-type lipoprotein export system ATPase subunit
MSQVPHIICTDIFKIFKVADLEVVALRGLDLTIDQGEVVAIVGASGSGKTTFLNILAGYDKPSAGTIEVTGRDLVHFSDKEAEYYRRSEIGFVWQQTSRNLFPYLTAFENVQLPMKLNNLGRGESIKNAALELLDLVGLKERAHQIPENLSGGEQQRTAIAVGLANQPSILLADEPTGELDDQTASDILDLFGKINSELGTTIIIVTHDPQIAYKVRRVVLIQDGKTSKEIIRNDEYRRISGEASENRQLDEFTLIDTNGRLQIPVSMLEDLDITGKAKLELFDNYLKIYGPETTDG